MAKHKVPPAFARAVATHRNRLEKVITAQGAGKMKQLYEEAADNVMGRIRRAVGTGKGTTFTVHQQRMALVQLRQGTAVMAKKLAGDLRPLSKKAQEESLKGLAKDVNLLSKAFTGSELTLPIEEAATFAGVINGRASALLRMHSTSMQRYGASIVGRVEQQLALNLLQGKSPHEVYEEVAQTIDGEWWQGERIVRTELAYAFNATHADGIAESAQEIPELRQRWEEHCNELGQPLDNRVAVDSIAMHGQVSSAGGEFFMPDDAPFPDAKGNTQVPAALVGLSWDFPPNRPNDRAVLSPWMPDWGVPGWEYRAGSRFWLVR